MSETPIGDQVQAEQQDQGQTVQGTEQVDDVVVLTTPYAIPDPGAAESPANTDPAPALNDDADDDLSDVPEGEDDGDSDLEDDPADGSPEPVREDLGPDVVLEG